MLQGDRQVVVTIWQLAGKECGDRTRLWTQDRNMKPGQEIKLINNPEQECEARAGTSTPGWHMETLAKAFFQY